VTSTIAELLLESTRVLHSAGVPEARKEAGSLLAHVLERDRTFLITHPEDSVPDELTARLQEFLQRRSRGEPLQYLTGHQEFYGLDFEVSPSVLIPRPETELVVEAALEFLSKDGPSLVCDVGTGSGCIAISLLHHRDLAHAVAIDVSTDALSVARTNATKHRVHDRIMFVACDGLTAISRRPVFDVVVSNPPYVTEQAMPGLQREVRDYEPRIALTPGGDGLRIIRKLLADSPSVLKRGGHLLIEIGFDQNEAVRDLVDREVWELLDIHQDLQGIPRLVALQKTAS
jgi:release factor glutamine methyltransferase